MFTDDWSVDYVDERKRIVQVSNGDVDQFQSDYVGAGSYNIFAGIFVAFIFGAAFVRPSSILRSV